MVEIVANDISGTHSLQIRKQLYLLYLEYKRIICKDIDWDNEFIQRKLCIKLGRLILKENVFNKYSIHMDWQLSKRTIRNNKLIEIFGELK